MELEIYNLLWINGINEKILHWQRLPSSPILVMSKTFLTLMYDEYIIFELCLYSNYFLQIFHNISTGIWNLWLVHKQSINEKLEGNIHIFFQSILTRSKILLNKENKLHIPQSSNKSIDMFIISFNHQQLWNEFAKAYLRAWFCPPSHGRYSLQINKCMIT